MRLLVLLVKTLDLLQVLHVAVSNLTKLVFALLLLLEQTLIMLHCGPQLLLELLGLQMSVIDCLLLPVELSLQVTVLVPPLVVDHRLLVYLSAQSLDQSDISVDPLRVLLFNLALLVIQPAEGLL